MQNLHGTRARPFRPFAAFCLGWMCNDKFLEVRVIVRTNTVQDQRMSVQIQTFVVELCTDSNAVVSGSERERGREQVQATESLNECIYVSVQSLARALLLPLTAMLPLPRPCTISGHQSTWQRLVLDRPSLPAHATPFTTSLESL